MTTGHCVMLPLSAVEPVIGRAFAVGPDAQERTEGVKRVEASVKSERELIEVGLQVLGLDAPVVRALQPRLEVRKNKVDDGQKFFGHLGASALHDRKVFIAECRKRIVSPPCVRDDHRTRFYGLLYKTRQGLSAAIGNDFQPQPAGIPPAAPRRVVALLWGTLADLDGGTHKHLILGAATFAAHRATDVGFVNLDMIAARKVATDAITPLAHHSSAELMQDIERGFVPAQTKLALKLDCRYARRHAGDEVSTPKPRRQRRFGVLHNRPAHQARIPLASPATKDGRSCGKAVGLALFLAVRALKSSMPADLLKIGRASRIVGEKGLKALQRCGEREIVALMDIVDLGCAVHTQNTSSSSLGCQPDKHD